MVLLTVLTLELPPFPLEDCPDCTVPPLCVLPEGDNCSALGSEDESLCWAKLAPQSTMKAAVRMPQGIT